MKISKVLNGIFYAKFIWIISQYTSNEINNKVNNKVNIKNKLLKVRFILLINRKSN